MTQSDNRTPHPMTEDSTETLKPCPFCGGEEIGHRGLHSGGIAMVCMACGCTQDCVLGSPENADTWDRAQSRWNTRIPTPTTGGAGELVKLLREARQHLAAYDIYSFKQTVDLCARIDTLIAGKGEDQ